MKTAVNQETVLGYQINQYQLHKKWILKKDGMVIIIGLIIGLTAMDMPQMVFSQVLMSTPEKLTLVTISFIKLPKVSQEIDSNANGMVNLELKKEESLISKLDLMMVQDSGLMEQWLLITGDFMELDLEKEVLNLERDITLLK